MDPTGKPLNTPEPASTSEGPKPTSRFRITRNRLNFLFGLMGYSTWLSAFLYARHHSTTFEIPMVVSFAGGLGAVTCISMGFLIILRKLQRIKAPTVVYLLLITVTLAIIYFVSGLFVKPLIQP